MMPQDYGRRFTYEAIEKLADFLLTLDQQTAVEEGFMESSRAE
jgi:hypothetical protein